MTLLARLLHQEPQLFEPGDRMGREEFISRWERTPELKLADDGVAVLARLEAGLASEEFRAFQQAHRAR